MAVVNQVDHRAGHEPRTGPGGAGPVAGVNRVDRWARLSLLGALGLAVLGKVLDLSGVTPFWGGLLFAFGESALVGGLAASLPDLARRAREQGWLEPLLREWIRKLHQWADSPQSKAIIYQRLQQAATTYRERGWFKKVTYQLAERFGGIDLEDAAGVLQAEVGRF